MFLKEQNFRNVRAFGLAIFDETATPFDLSACMEAKPGFHISLIFAAGILCYLWKLSFATATARPLPDEDGTASQGGFIIPPLYVPRVATRTGGSISMPKLRIAIVGAGIGGLTLASAIRALDHDEKVEIDIYESSAELMEVGLGINLWPRAYELLNKIGLESEVLKLCGRVTDESALYFEFRKSDQSNGQPILNMYGKGGLVRIHRSDLQKTLLKCLSSSCRLRLSSRLLSYTENPDDDGGGGGVRLEFQDGSTRSCDLLVGADGIKSTVRKLFLGKQEGDEYRHSIEPVWSGTYGYRGLIVQETLLKKFPGHRATKAPVMYIGKSGHLVVYPITQGMINFHALWFDPTKEDTRHDGPWVVDFPREELLSVFDGWEPEVQALIECIPKPSRWAIHHLRPLKTFGKGRVLVIGDAAHAMTPHKGAGAGQAMEDAYVLAHIILGSKNPQLDREIHPSIITQVYDAVRRPVANEILRLSQVCGKLTNLIDEEGELPMVEERDGKVSKEVVLGYVEKLERHWRWLWGREVEEECQRAAGMIQELVRTTD